MVKPFSEFSARKWWKGLKISAICSCPFTWKILISDFCVVLENKDVAVVVVFLFSDGTRQLDLRISVLFPLSLSSWQMLVYHHCQRDTDLQSKKYTLLKAHLFFLSVNLCLLKNGWMSKWLKTLCFHLPV